MATTVLKPERQTKRAVSYVVDLQVNESAPQPEIKKRLEAQLVQTGTENLTVEAITEKLNRAEKNRQKML